MSADIIPFVPRRDRQRRAIGFSLSATAPDDLVMDHADTAPCEYAAPEESDAPFVEDIHA